MNLGGQVERPGKVVAGAGRDISKSDPGAVADPVYHLVYRAVAANHHQRMLLPVGCDLIRDPNRMARVFRVKYFIVNSSFFQFRFCQLPDHPAAPGTGFRIYDKCIFQTIPPSSVRNLSRSYCPDIFQGNVSYFPQSLFLRCADTTRIHCR